MSAHPCEAVAKRIYRQAFTPGIIYRTYENKHYDKKYYCSECGSRLHSPKGKKCPVCGVRWTAEFIEPDKRSRERCYHMEFEAKGDIQVTRIYRVERHVRLGRKVLQDVWEVERIMYAPDGRRCVFTKGFRFLVIEHNTRSNPIGLKIADAKVVKISFPAKKMKELFVCGQIFFNFFRTFVEKWRSRLWLLRRQRNYPLMTE